MKEAKNAESKEVGLEVKLDPVRDKAQDGSHLDIDLCLKNGADCFNKVFLWVQKEITSIKAKQVEEAKKIETLEAIGTGKFSSLLECLSDLTKAINNAEEIINAKHNSFQTLENRARATEKRMEGVEKTLKNIGEQSHKILKATSDYIKVLISKLESDQGEKPFGDTTEVKEDTPEDKEMGPGRRTRTSTRKKKNQSREIEEIKKIAENMEQLELEAAELLKIITQSWIFSAFSVVLAFSPVCYVFLLLAFCFMVNCLFFLF